ncbi:MAG: hypothetical protein QXS93_00610 [Candidatus Micrarchaeia archaeon]
MNDYILITLQKMTSEYKREIDPHKKIQKLWILGDFLVEHKMVSQKTYWNIQNKKIYVSRALLLRGYWLRSAFTKEDISKIRLPISKLLPVLSYLAPNSKKLNANEKNQLKYAILNNQIPKIILSKKSKIRKIESNQLSNKIYTYVNKLKDDEVYKFREKFNNKDFETLKISMFDLLRFDLPKEQHIVILNKAKSLCEKEGLDTLLKIFSIMEIASKKTKLDSRVIMKRVFDPVLLSPFLNKMFFQNQKK